MTDESAKDLAAAISKLADAIRVASSPLNNGGVAHFYPRYYLPVYWEFPPHTNIGGGGGAGGNGGGTGGGAS